MPEARSRRQFLKASAVTVTLAAIPLRVPAPATLLEAGAALCVVLVVTSAAVTAVVHLCRPRYTLYWRLNEAKTDNGGREYFCSACSRAEAETQELNKCEGGFTDLPACQAKAQVANTNYSAVACGPMASQTQLRAAITLERTATPDDPTSWVAAATPQMVDLTEDDPQASFTLPREDGAMFFRARANQV